MVGLQTFNRISVGFHRAPSKFNRGSLKFQGKNTHLARQVSEWDNNRARGGCCRATNGGALPRVTAEAVVASLLRPAPEEPLLADITTRCSAVSMCTNAAASWSMACR
jgi:hypothetical protein